MGVARVNIQHFPPYNQQLSLDVVSGYHHPQRQDGLRCQLHSQGDASPTCARTTRHTPVKKACLASLDRVCHNLLKSSDHLKGKNRLGQTSPSRCRGHRGRSPQRQWGAESIPTTDTRASFPTKCPPSSPPHPTLDPSWRTSHSGQRTNKGRSPAEQAYCRAMAARLQPIAMGARLQPIFAERSAHRARERTSARG